MCVQAFFGLILLQFGMCAWSVLCYGEGDGWKYGKETCVAYNNPTCGITPKEVTNCEGRKYPSSMQHACTVQKGVWV